MFLRCSLIRLARLKFLLILSLLCVKSESAAVKVVSKLEDKLSHVATKDYQQIDNLDASTSAETDNLKNSNLHKRSLDTLSAYYSYNGYNPSRWIDNYMPGYSRYSSRFGYDPFSLYRRKKLYPRMNMRPYLKSYVDNADANWALNHPMQTDSILDDSAPNDYDLVDDVSTDQLTVDPVLKRKYYFPVPRLPYGEGDDLYSSQNSLENSRSNLRQDKRSIIPYDLLYYYDGKRSPSEMGARGFHEGIFTHGFGDFSPVKRSKREAVNRRQEIDEYPYIFNNDFPFQNYKRKSDWDSSGFHGDTFSGGFGDFSTMRKRRPEMDSYGFHGDTFNGGFGDFYTMKRRPEMSASGFHGDTFSGGFGDFYTMKRDARRNKRGASNGIMDKRRPEMTSSGFNGDTFSNGFGDFYTMKRQYNKRVPEMTSSGFHGDTFSGGFGDFHTMKRRPEMTSSGFHGDTFSGGFGDFQTMKRDFDKRRPEMTSSGFHGDTFSGGFGDFHTMKRRPEMTSSGFHGDTFSGGFGDFHTMKRGPEMTSSGFHGDTFSGGFGDFYTMKKSYNGKDLQQRANDVERIDQLYDKTYDKNTKESSTKVNEEESPER